MNERFSYPGMGFHPLRVALVLRTPGGGFRTVRDGIDTGDPRFRPRFAGVADVWRDF